MPDLKPGDDVAFMAVPPVNKGKNRRAEAVLVVGDYAEATLVAAPNDQRQYGWLEIKDGEGHRWLLYMRASATHPAFLKGQPLEFKLVIGSRGPEATEVTLPSQEDVA